MGAMNTKTEQRPGEPMQREQRRSVVYYSRLAGQFEARRHVAECQRALTREDLDERHVLAAFAAFPELNAWKGASASDIPDDDVTGLSDWMLAALGVVGPFSSL